MTTTTRSAYSDTLGLQLLRELGDAGRWVFTMEQAREEGERLSISEGYLRFLLSRLADGPWLERLRRGLYLIVERGQGRNRVHPFVIATALVPDAVIGGWSALRHHGLTEQLPNTVQALTLRKVVTPSMRDGRRAAREGKHVWEVRGTRFEYETVRPERLFGVVEVWVDAEARVPILDRERAMLEGFIAPRTFGGMEEVLGLLEEHLDELDLPKLVSYAGRYGKASVAKRLGWALEAMEVAEAVWAPLQALPISGFRALDPTRSQRGPYDKRWMIQDNRDHPSG